MSLEQHIRKMARSQYYQEIFNASQKCSGIHLFENISNFSGLQSLFIYWLRVYNLLYEELGKMDWENLDEKSANAMERIVFYALDKMRHEKNQDPELLDGFFMRDLIQQRLDSQYKTWQKIILTSSTKEEDPEKTEKRIADGLVSYIEKELSDQERLAA